MCYIAPVCWQAMLWKFFLSLGLIAVHISTRVQPSKMKITCQKYHFTNNLHACCFLIHPSPLLSKRPHMTCIQLQQCDCQYLFLHNFAFGTSDKQTKGNTLLSYLWTRKQSVTVSGQTQFCVSPMNTCLSLWKLPLVAEQRETVSTLFSLYVYGHFDLHS